VTLVQQNFQSGEGEKVWTFEEQVCPKPGITRNVESRERRAREDGVGCTGAGHDGRERVVVKVNIEHILITTFCTVMDVTQRLEYHRNRLELIQREMFGN
jgi:hypothetical protein